MFKSIYIMNKSIYSMKKAKKNTYFYQRFMQETPNESCKKKGVEVESHEINFKSK
jgi:hypothetical protein